MSRRPRKSLRWLPEDIDNDIVDNVDTSWGTGFFDTSGVTASLATNANNIEAPDSASPKSQTVDTSLETEVDTSGVTTSLATIAEKIEAPDSASPKSQNATNFLFGFFRKSGPSQQSQPLDQIERSPNTKKTPTKKTKTTDLHKACADSDSIHKIRSILREAPYLAGIQDEFGQSPLHYISQNGDLIQEAIRTGSSDEIDSFILDELLINDPLGASAECLGGFIPFTYPIHLWIKQAHVIKRISGRPSEFRTGIRVAAAELGQDTKSSRGVLDAGGSTCLDSRTITQGVTSVPPLVKWCFHMLSCIIASSKKTADVIVQKVASINCIVKTILMIKDDELRDEIFNFNIMQHVLVSRESCGGWLQHMFKSSNQQAQEKAVIYLKMISDIPVCKKSYANINQIRNSSSIKGTKFTGKFTIYKEIEKDPNSIVSMIKLPERLFREAAATDAIQWSLDRIIFRPMSLFIMLCDIFFLVILLVNFKLSSSSYFEGFGHQKDSDGNCSHDHDGAKFVFHMVMVIASSVYFLVRNMIAVWNIPWNALKHNYVFQLSVDLISIVMTISIEVVFLVRIDHFDEFFVKYENCDFLDPSTMLRTAAAITLLFLFIKTLLWVKMVNRYLATFVLTIIEITKDIFWFLLILLLILVLSALMFHTILYQPWNTKCKEMTDTNKPYNPFCDPNMGRSYLEVYTIMFGEFNIEYFYTKFSVVLFTLYTFSVVIILLNVLIAIVSDSYDKSVLQSAHLFGRARVLFVAELLSFQRAMLNNAVGDLSHRWSGRWLKPLLESKFSICFREHFYLTVLFFFRALLGKSSSDMNLENVWNGRLQYMKEDVTRKVNESEDRLRKSMEDSIDLARHENRQNILAVHNKIASVDERMGARMRGMEERLLVALKTEISFSEQ